MEMKRERRHLLGRLVWLMLLLVFGLTTSAALAQSGKTLPPPPDEEPPPPPPPPPKKTTPPPPPPKKTNPAPPPPRNTTPTRPAPPREPAGPQPGDRTHDGTLIRMAPGGAYVHDFLVDNADNTLEAFGGGFMAGASVGYAAVENFILHADFFFYAAGGPCSLINGSEIGAPSVDQLQATSFGLGFTWYFWNHPDGSLFIASAVGASIFSYQTEGEIYTSPIGLGTYGMIGHEWWVSENWGIGVGGKVIYTLNPSTLYKNPHNTIAAGAVLLLTYN